MTPPRFSLRALLIATAFLAGFCYLRDLPRQDAEWFAARSHAGERQAANAMVIKYGYR